MSAEQPTPSASALSVVPATRSRADELLANLGTTRDQVADALLAAEVTGQQLMCGACPIAVYLLKYLPGAVEVLVNQDQIKVTYGNGDVEYVNTPAVIDEFIYDFDGGDYPSLIAWGDR